MPRGPWGSGTLRHHDTTNPFLGVGQGSTSADEGFHGRRVEKQLLGRGRDRDLLSRPKGDT